MAYMRTLTILLAAQSLLLLGCERNQIPAAADAALESASVLELLSLEPHPSEGAEGERFGEWLVLGSTNLDASSRRKVIAALRQGMPYYDDGSRADCFWPRHGLRVRHEGKTYKFVICFQCTLAGVSQDDSPLGNFVIRESPQLVFDKALFEAGIPLAKTSAELVEESNARAN